MSDTLRPRRYYLMNRIEAGRRREFALRDVWHAKQDGEPGTALAGGFPSTTELAAAGYTTVEDLDGADAEELQDYVGISQSDATAVLAALAAP